MVTTAPDERSHFMGHCIRKGRWGTAVIKIKTDVRVLFMRTKSEETAQPFASTDAGHIRTNQDSENVFHRFIYE